MLMPDQRALLVMHCNDHPVAVCPKCSEALTFERIGADIIMGKRDFCPMCRADLAPVVLKHLAECTLMRVQGRETRERTRGIRPDAPETSTQSQQLRDHADVLAGDPRHGEAPIMDKPPPAHLL